VERRKKKRLRGLREKNKRIKGEFERWFLCPVRGLETRKRIGVATDGSGAGCCEDSEVVALPGSKERTADLVGSRQPEGNEIIDGTAKHLPANGKLKAASGGGGFVLRDVEQGGKFGVPSCQEGIAGEKMGSGSRIPGEICCWGRRTAMIEVAREEGAARVTGARK